MSKIVLGWVFLVFVGLIAVAAMVLFGYSIWIQKKYVNLSLPSPDVVEETEDDVWYVDDSTYSEMEDPDALKMLKEVNNS